jgi:iron complex outermembrane receptor protein
MAGRVAAVGPDDQLAINFAGEYAERHFTPQNLRVHGPERPGQCAHGAGLQRGRLRPGGPAYPQTLCVPANTNFLSSVDRGNFTAPTYGLGDIDQETYAVRGRAAYEFSDAATLTYIGGYRNFKQTSYLPLPVIYQSYGFESTSDTQSHELRLNGTIGRFSIKWGLLLQGNSLQRIRLLRLADRLPVSRRVPS